MFSSFKEILEKRLKEYKFGKKILGLRICELWEEEVEKVLGKAVAKQIKPLYFRGDTLVIQVENPIFSQELRFFEEELKEKINKRLKGLFLKRVFYRTKNCFRI